MSGWGGLLLIAGWMFGPDGFAVHRQLLAAATASASLPVDRLLAAADDSWIVWHHDRSWAPAFYSPPDQGVALLALAAAAGRRAPAGGEVERLLPDLTLPRLFLYAPTYRPGGTVTDLSEQPVDVAEAYFHALLELYLDRESRRPRSWFGRLAEDRGTALMADVPPQGRRQAYADAVSAFAAHLLSIAHEIDRASRRAGERGEDLCALLDPPRTLFGLWQRSIRSGVYPGRYLSPSVAGGARSLSTSRRGLAEVDKRQILEQLFQNRWTGDPVRDFASLCPPVPGE